MRSAANHLTAHAPDCMRALRSLRLAGVTFALALGVIVSSTVHADAAGPCELPEVRFHYEPARIDDSPGEWTKAMSTAAFGQLERVQQIVRASPLLTPLPNYRLLGVLSTGLPDGHPNIAADGANAPLPSFYVLRFFASRSWQGGCALTENATAAATVTVVANVLGTILEDEKSPLLSDIPERFYLEPKLVRRVGGYTQYENGTVLVTRNGRAPLVHVSQERWLRAVITMFRQMVKASERDMAEQEGERVDAGAQGDAAVAAMDSAIASLEQLYEAMKSTDPKAAADLKKNIEKMRAERPAAQANAEKMHALQPTIDAQREKNRDVGGAQLESTREQIRKIEAYLAGLTPAERRADAYYGSRIEYGYTVPSPGPNDRRVVMLNPDFFDRNAPRTAFQVFAVVSSFEGGSDVYQQTPADQFAERVIGSLDYARLAALLAR